MGAAMHRMRAGRNRTRNRIRPTRNRMRAVCLLACPTANVASPPRWPPSPPSRTNGVMGRGNCQVVKKMDEQTKRVISRNLAASFILDHQDEHLDGSSPERKKDFKERLAAVESRMEEIHLSDLQKNALSYYDGTCKKCGFYTVSDRLCLKCGFSSRHKLKKGRHYRSRSGIPMGMTWQYWEQRQRKKMISGWCLNGKVLCL